MFAEQTKSMENVVTVKKGRGGARPGAGRPRVFFEKMIELKMTIPQSKATFVKGLVNELKEKWKLEQSGISPIASELELLGKIKFIFKDQL